MGDLGQDFIKYFDKFEFVVKGSACRTFKNGDLAHDVSIVKPSKQAGDIDVGIKLKAGWYEEFEKDMKRLVQELNIKGKIDDVLHDKLMSKLDNSQMLKYDEFFIHLPVGNSNFLNKFRNGLDNHTNFAKGDINFAVIKESSELVAKSGKYDLLPEITFKYN